MQHLVHDLSWGEMPTESSLTGCAERATNGASRLAGDADGDPLCGPAAPRISHQHRLDPLAVVQLMHRFGGEPSIRADDVAVLDAREAKCGCEVGPQRPGEIGQIRERAHVGPVDSGQDLACPVRRLAAGVEPRGELCVWDLADRRRYAGERQLSHDVR